MRERTYTTFQIAELCGVYPTTVINWIKQGTMKAYKTPGGHRRVLKSDLEAFLEKYHFPASLEPAQGRRILIVEDDRSVGAMLQRAFQKQAPDFEVQWMSNGIEALLALGKEPPALVVLDVVMPVVDGAKVLATLRADPNTRGVKVVGITGKRLPPEKLRFMKRHTDAFFLKPCDVKELVARSLALIGAGRAAQPA